MNITSLLDQINPRDRRLALRDRFRARRKEHKLSQATLAKKSGVSLGSLKRFESSGEVSLSALIKLATALGYESDFDKLFAQKHYQSIEDVLEDENRNR